MTNPFHTLLFDFSNSLRCLHFQFIYFSTFAYLFILLFFLDIVYLYARFVYILLPVYLSSV